MDQYVLLGSNQIILTVFPFTRVALDHLVSALEAREGHLRNRVLLVSSLLSREHRRIGSEREMNTGEPNWAIVEPVWAEG